MNKQLKKYFKRAHHIHKLSADQKERPETVLNTFFDDLTVDGIRREFFEWLHCAMANQSCFYQGGMERSNLIFLYERIELLVEASFVLYKRNGWYKDAFKEVATP